MKRLKMKIEWEKNKKIVSLLKIFNKKNVRLNIQKSLAMGVVLWSNTYRYLSREGSAEVGKFNIDRTPYLREPLEKFTQEGVRGIALMLASQLGKSETLNNIVGWIIHINQCPTMIVQPTETLAEEYSKERIAPMLRDTPVLSEIMKESNNDAIKYKTFPGGYLSFRGTGAANKLASKPIGIALCDEIDRFQVTREGDPLTLVRRRLETFKEDARLFLSGTPTIKGLSPIESEYLNSTQGEWHIPCPECGEYVTFSWDRMKFTEDLKEEPRMSCPICETENIEDVWKANRQLDGKWIHKDLEKDMYGYKLSALASPWMTWKKIVQEYLERKDDLEKLKAFHNTVLGETWDEEVRQEIGYEMLHDRREEYDELPEEVKVIILAIDVQGSWFQMEYVGYGEGHESWGLGVKRLYLDLSEVSNWEILDEYIEKQFTNSETGRILDVQATVIDTGGLFTDQAYDFISPRQRQAVYGIKGMRGIGTPGFNGSKPTKCGRIDLISLGVSTLKGTVYSRLSINSKRAGYCHFPLDAKRGYDLEYFKSLTAEVKKINKSGNVVWEKTRERNEGLDLRAYIEGILLAIGIGTEELKRMK